MPKKLPSSFTIRIDTREQKPLIFPSYVRVHYGGTSHTLKLNTKSVALPTGDYSIEGYEDIVLVERKGSSSELFKNFCTIDAKRANAAFGRLSLAKHAYLLAEISPSDFLIDTEHCPDSTLMTMRLATTIRKYKLHLILAGRGSSVGHRRIVGGFIVRLMLGHILDYCY